MTDGTFSTPPPLRPNEFEGGVLSNKVFHGLIYFYVFDFLVLIKFLIEYFSGHNISSYISEPLFIILFIAILIIVELLITDYFVYRKKKYLKYCEEFDKEPKSTKLMWSILIVLLYIFAIIVMVLIFHFGQTYIPKPV